MDEQRPVYCSAECMVVGESLAARVLDLERELRDHAQRFDTLQTPWWKRLWFAIDGWPWYDLNGRQRRRPWHRGG